MQQVGESLQSIAIKQILKEKGEAGSKNEELGCPNAQGSVEDTEPLIMAVDAIQP